MFLSKASTLLTRRIHLGCLRGSRKLGGAGEGKRNTDKQKDSVCVVDYFSIYYLSELFYTPLTYLCTKKCSVKLLLFISYVTVRALTVS